ncbi:MAG: S41 family peptidase [Bryobacteraceae bacterium]
MKQFCLLATLLSIAAPVSAQLTADQKVVDLQSLASLYAKNYAPYEWKRDTQRFDLLNLTPWLDRARRSKDDIEFFEVAAQYVASLNDVHSQYLVPSDFVADLSFTVDLYDGKALIDEIIRSNLPVREYPFEVGDELISVDGKTVEEWLTEFGKYSVFGNSRSTRRYNAQLITLRFQSLYPRAHEIGGKAAVVVRRRTGNLETYSIVWDKFGEPVTFVGPVLSPRMSSAKGRMADGETEGEDEGESETEERLPRYMRSWLQRQTHRLPDARSVRGVEDTPPVFAMPANFRQSLGRSFADFFFSGTYEASGKRIGFIRIPTFLPSQTLSGYLAAIRQFQTEIGSMRQNTDALVIDVMRNYGGFNCYAEALLQSVIPYRFQGSAEEIRVTRDRLVQAQADYADARDFGAEQWVVDLLGDILKQIQQAYKENRGRTGGIPVCAPNSERDPITDRAGNNVAYAKPVLVLADEFTTSAAEIFAAMFQDSGRGPVVGMRTAGAGGSVAPFLFPAGYYSEASASVTNTIVVRSKTIAAPDFPATAYIENVGVRPDRNLDFMTEDNLRNRGRTFVDAFTAAAVELIK